MTYRHHLFIDSLGQAILIIFFGLLIAGTESPVNMLELMPIMLFGWQFLNALISYKFFERHTKQNFVRFSALGLILIFGIRGILWFASLIPSIEESLEQTTLLIESYIYMILPIYCAFFSVGYLYLTFKDLNNAIFRTY
jgi:uncharacterized membrane protein